MAQYDKQKFCIWLIYNLNERGIMYKQEIIEEWNNAKDFNGGFNLLEKTFENYMRDIKRVVGINITCNEKTYFYKISEGELARFKNYVLQTYPILMMTFKHGVHKLRDRIIFPKMPKGAEYLTDIFDAMESDSRIDVMYKNYKDGITKYYLLEPYCLKTYKNCWHLVAKKTDGELHTFALDRIQSIQIRKGDTFVIDSDFDAEVYFRDTYGIYRDSAPPCQVFVYAERMSRHYLRDQPLHHSQREYKIDDNSSMFMYNIIPTNDFLYGILSRGTDLQVISPLEVRDRVQKMAQTLCDRYNSPLPNFNFNIYDESSYH